MTLERLPLGGCARALLPLTCVLVTITCRLYRDGHLNEHHLRPEDISEVLPESGSLVWLDVEGTPSVDTIRMLSEEFGFHELALEDSVHEHQRPKVEQYGSHFFVVVYGASASPDDLRLHEMAVFVASNYLVTIRKDPAWDLTQVAKRWEANSDLVEQGGGYLLYILLDQVVDGYFDALDVFEDRSEEIEERISSPDPDLQSEIFRLRRNLLRFRRSLAPLREVLDVMQRRTVDVVTPPLEPYYRDVYDHVLRATDFLDNLRDLLSAAFDAHLSVVSNTMNAVMKKLTAWAAIILVPTLIAGIYGMNFNHMPELRWRFGYAWALGLMAAAGLVLHRMFKRRDWL